MHPGVKIITIIALFLVGNVLAAIVIGAFAMANGLELAEIADVLTGQGEGSNRLMMRTMLWVQAIFSFFLPAILFGVFFYRKRILDYFRITRSPHVIALLLGGVIIAAGYPLVNLVHEVNGLAPLPDWMRTMEDTAAEMMQDILSMDSFGGMLLTVLLVAILPGIGEELVFRGIVQRQFGEWFKNPILAIWAAAFVFSLIHFQFEGFLARMALGAILGYLFYWTKNLWVPIFAHALNNAVPVVALYYTGTDLTQIEAEQDIPVNFISIVISIAVLYFASQAIKKYRHHEA